MDILISSNLERLLYLLCGRNAEKLRAYMAELSTKGAYTVEKEVLDSLQSEFAAGFADDEQTSQTIGRLFRKTGYLCDTHTAVAVKVYQDYADKTGDQTPTVIASTASPFKFAGSVLPAISVQPQGDDFALLDELSAASGLPAPKALAELKEKTERFTDVVESAKMKNAVAQWLTK